MLRLRGNPLGEEGVQDLAQAIQTGSSLLELDVGSCEVGAEFTTILPSAQATSLPHCSRSPGHLFWAAELPSIHHLALHVWDALMRCRPCSGVHAPHSLEELQMASTSKAATMRGAMLEQALLPRRHSLVTPCTVQ